jgi:predicted nucleic acid-binding protein
LTYLLETNVVSEVRKREPHASVTRWFAGVSADELFLSVLVVGEIRQGADRLRRRDATQAEVYDRWLATLEREYAERILPVTTAIAHSWGRLNAVDPLPVVDGLLAATALVHGLVLMTRADRHLGRVDVPRLNPWGVTG